MASKFGGYMGEALWVDLTNRTFRPYEISDRDREMFIGNKGIASKILWDNLRAGIDPLGEENLLIVSTAPITGTGAPCSSRFNVTCKSPLTNGIMDSNCGGTFGIHLKKAGFDVLILAGKADKPVYLEINEEGVVFHDAADLWGLNTEVTQEKMIEKYGKNSGRMVIGPAGENLVRYACILSGERALGRGGVGAVMGSKMVKVMVAHGKKRPPLPDAEAYKEFIKSWIAMLKGHPVTGEALPALGTGSHLNKASASGVLPTKNYSKGTYEDAYEISGEKLAETFLEKNEGCQSCPIRCARVVKFQDRSIKGPEYETMTLFGSNLGNKDLGKIIEWNYQVDLLGMDTISLGNVFGFTMELTEKGLIKSDLKWGRTDNIAAVIDDIAYRRGLGDDMAEGVLRMSEKFGGSDYAIHAKGLEMAAYEPRRSVGQGLGYATANRGACHLNSGFLMYFENLGPVNINPQSTMGKVGFNIFQQNTFDAVSACGSCIFTTYVILPGFTEKISPFGTIAKVVDKVLRVSGPVVSNLFKLPEAATPLHLPGLPHTKALEVSMGTPFKLGKFLKAGNRIYNLQRMFNVREGLVANELPKRITNEPQVEGRSDTLVPLEKMLPSYYSARGWDKRGVPTKKTLEYLGLEYLIEALPGEKTSAESIISGFQKHRLEVEKAQATMIKKRVADNKKVYAKMQKAK